jgi:negative regulator of sigma E activity
MRRVTALCAAALVVASTAAVARPMPQQSGYYVIRWDNTGVCQIWNTNLQQQPVHFLSDYKVVSKPVPTFTEAAAIQEKMRVSRACTF